MSDVPDDCAGRERGLPLRSDRCRVIDLGKWASGGYVISSPAFNRETGDPELLDELDGLRDREHSDSSGGGGDVQ